MFIRLHYRVISRFASILTRSSANHTTFRSCSSTPPSWWSHSHGKRVAVSSSSNLLAFDVFDDYRFRKKKKKGYIPCTRTQRNRQIEKILAKNLDINLISTLYGWEIGLHDYKYIIGYCVDKAKESKNEEDSLNHIHNAYKLLKGMKDEGFQAKEDIYGPLLLYLLNEGMVEEFDSFREVIKDANYSMPPEIGYYEMLLWICVGNEEKIQELCNFVVSDAGTNEVCLAENYLLALCETGGKMELLKFLEVFDITRISSLHCMSALFKAMGRLLLENHAEKLIQALRTSEVQAKNVSFFISSYVIGMPYLAVGDAISKFEDLHEKFEVGHSSISYDRLLMHCCKSLKVGDAISKFEDLHEKFEVGHPSISYNRLFMHCCNSLKAMMNERTDM